MNQDQVEQIEKDGQLERIRRTRRKKDPEKRKNRIFALQFPSESLVPYCRLNQLMEEKGLGVDFTDIEEKTGITWGTLSRLYHSAPFTDESPRIDLTICKALMNYFDCTLDDLFEYRKVQDGATSEQS